MEVPEWETTDEAVAWFVQLRKETKDLVYRYASIIQKAMSIFEKTKNTEDADYRALSSNLRQLWNDWSHFKRQTKMTTEFLRDSVLYYNFRDSIVRMKSPRSIAKKHSLRMSKLRDSARDVLKEIETLKLALERGHCATRGKC